MYHPALKALIISNEPDLKAFEVAEKGISLEI